MSTRQEDTRDISLVLCAIVALGLIIFFNGGGWIGAGLYAVVVLLIFGFGG